MSTDQDEQAERMPPGSPEPFQGAAAAMAPDGLTPLCVFSSGCPGILCPDARLGHIWTERCQKTGATEAWKVFLIWDSPFRWTALQTHSLGTLFWPIQPQSWGTLTKGITA